VTGAAALTGAQQVVQTAVWAGALLAAVIVICLTVCWYNRR
jgi:hypothetical protein